MWGVLQWLERALRAWGADVGLHCTQEELGFYSLDGTERKKFLTADYLARCNNDRRVANNAMCRDAILWLCNPHDEPQWRGTEVCTDELVRAAVMVGLAHEAYSTEGNGHKAERDLDHAMADLADAVGDFETEIPS